MNRPLLPLLPLLRWVLAAALLPGAVIVGVAGCRGQISDKPPIRPIRDMREQPKYRPEAASAFFPDGRAMRMPVEGTVAQGTLGNLADGPGAIGAVGARGVDESGEEGFATGRTEKGYLARAPLAVTEATLKRGQERFNIYCAACHDRAGSGRGMAVQRGFPPPVDLISARVRNFADGEIFEVITRGVRNMPSYAVQVPQEDRWTIVAWVRVLQRSQHASIGDVPAERRGLIEPEGK